MKVNRNLKLLFSIMLLSVFCSPLCAFSGKTHKAMTEKAILSSGTSNYLTNHLGIDERLGATLLLDQSTVPEPDRIPTDQFEDRIFPKLPANPCTILDFLKAGAHLEDVPMPRARHHFHAPIANPGITPPNPNSGLDNQTDHNDWEGAPTWVGWIPLGESSLNWATTGIASWEPITNTNTWEDARDDFYSAVTHP